MTSKISLVKKHPVFSFFKFTLKKQTPLTLLVSAFTLLLCPGILLRDANDDLIREYNLGYWEFATYSFIILAAAVALVCMLLLLNFNFLFNKKAGDMYNALPLTRNQLLLSRSISAFIGGLFLMSVSYAGLVLVNFLPTVEGVGVVTATNTYLFMLLSLMVLTAFCLLFGVCCGGYFDTVIAFATVNVAPVIIVTFIFSFVQESTVGLVFDSQYLVYLTPIAVVFYKLMNLTTQLERPENVIHAIAKTNAVTVIGLIVFGALCVFAAIKLFGKRKSETAGEAYAFKFMPIIISLLVSMVGGFVIAILLTGDYSINGGFWFFFIACSVLCSIAIGAITNRGFKKVKGSIITGAVAAALMATLVISGLYIADYAENRIPKAQSVKQVFIGEIDFTEHKELVVSLHKGIIESLNEELQIEYGDFPEIVNNFDNFNFNYVMKNGGIMKRNYWYRSPDMSKLHKDILTLMQTDNFFEKYEQCIVAEPNYALINVHSHSTKFGTMEEGEEQKNAILTEKEAEYLISLFKKEMQVADISVFKEETYGISVSGNEWCELYIPRSFTETIGFLETKFTEYENNIG